MFDYKLVRVEKILYRLFHRGFFHSQAVYLFGVSENTRQIIQILRGFGIEPVNVLDNDKVKQDNYCSGIKVIAVDCVRNIRSPQHVYIICSLYWREMTAQLRDRGVKKKNILMLYKEENLAECFGHAFLGRKIYKRLVSAYGNVPIFLCPYTGTGDIYLIGTFWKQYIRQNQIKDYVFLVLSKACEKAAKLFMIKNIMVLDKKVEGSYLIRYYMLCPKDVPLILLNDSWGQIHTNSLEWFRGYKGLGFMKLFRNFVFCLPDTARPEHPVFKNADREIERIVQNYQLKKGKTVILSPYSNTLADLPAVFWNMLASQFIHDGFTVCTNSCGEKEPAIPGTKAVFFPLDIAPQTVEWAGYFVGIRSGFCDIVSGAKAKKVILYHVKERFFNGSTYEYFNLRGMGLCDDVLEIQFGQDGVLDHAGKMGEENRSLLNQIETYFKE